MGQVIGWFVIAILPGVCIFLAGYCIGQETEREKQQRKELEELGILKKREDRYEKF